jgi:hypothetical protein
MPRCLTCVLGLSLGHSTHRTSAKAFGRLHRHNVTSQGNLFLCGLDCNLTDCFQHFINSLNRFERSLFAFDKLAVNSNELAPLLGLDVLKASNAVTLHPTVKTASSKGEYKTLASILCAYRTFEVLALDCETGVSQPPIRLLPPLAFNKSEQDSEKIVVRQFIYIF